MKGSLRASLLILISIFGFSCVAEEMREIKIVLDADRSRHIESADSILMGIETALSEIGSVVQNRKITVWPLDHRGNSTRSKLNMQKAMADKDTLLVVAGLHSPPLIKNRAYINENKILTLVPWAAGGPITRYPAKENWVFRLSIDDTKAGIRIIEHALLETGCKSPTLLLEQTPWGESNRNTMTKAINERLDLEPNLQWFNWSISQSSMKIKLRKAAAEGSDCIIFVGNSADGKTLSRAMSTMETKYRLPVFSHWGITGGDFGKTISHKMRTDMRLQFIQTCFSFISTEFKPFTRDVFNTLTGLFPQIKEPEDLEAPAGFIHAYDLTKILIQALSQITLTNDMGKNRDNLRVALENLESPVEGLIKTYNKPFSVFSEQHDDAHEALGLEDFCMAEYGPKNEIVLYK